MDVKDAVHSIQLSTLSEEYCQILPYFGSPHFRYEVLPMGLTIRSAKWMRYINILLENISYRSQYIAIMDDLLVHSLIKHHMDRLESLLQAIVKHGLELSPKKCQLFRKELVYIIGNSSTIKDQRMTSASQIYSRSNTKDSPPKNVKEYKILCRVVTISLSFLHICRNYCNLSMI